MTEATFTLARITAPEPAANPFGRRALGARLAALLGRTRTYLEDHLIPNPPETYHLIWRQMAHIHARKLTARLRRFEHILRCFILFLAAELLKSGVPLPALPARPVRAPRRKRPYDPLILVQGATPPVRTGFILLSPPRNAARPNRKPGPRPFAPLDWAETDATRQINRLAALTRALSGAEALAARLAARLQAGDFYTSSDMAGGPRMTEFWSGTASAHPTTLSAPRRGGDARAANPRKRPHFPGFFARLENWYPPPELIADSAAEDYDDLNQLHLAGCRALLACADA